MQEIVYEDGTKTKEKFNSLIEALYDTEIKNKKKRIKTLKITMTIPKKRR